MAKWRSPFKATSRETCSFKKAGSWAAGYHTGVDRVCSSNTTLVAPTACTVKRNEWDNSYGNFIVLLTSDGKSILMAHMKSKPSLKIGAKLDRGDFIGYMGNTGNSSGAHVHIEVENSKTWSYNKNLLNPNSYIDWSNFSNGTSTTSTVSYTVGKTYTTQVDLKVRTGAGTNYAQKKRSQLTADGQKHALSGTYAVLKKGTKVTVQEKKTVGKDIWLKIPSGWIAGYYDGDKYVK